MHQREQFLDAIEAILKRKRESLQRNERKKRSLSGTSNPNGRPPKTRTRKRSDDASDEEEGGVGDENSVPEDTVDHVGKSWVDAFANLVEPAAEVTEEGIQGGETLTTEEKEMNRERKGTAQEMLAAMEMGMPKQPELPGENAERGQRRKMYVDLITDDLDLDTLFSE